MDASDRQWEDNKQKLDRREIDPKNDAMYRSTMQINSLKESFFQNDIPVLLYNVFVNHFQVAEIKSR